MDEPRFCDPKSPPSDDEVAAALGRAHRHWQTLLAGVARLEPQAAGDWKFYKQGGWSYILKDKRRNLLYLRAGAGGILASMALGEKAYHAALVTELPPQLIEELQQAPKYPEGRPARVTVKTAADAKTVLKLVALKIAG